MINTTAKISKPDIIKSLPLRVTLIREVDKIMMIKFTYLLCWLGIHRYRVVDTTFGFGAAGSTQKLQCRNCGIQKIKRLN